MSPTVQLDTRDFNASLARLRTVNKRETVDFLRRIAKELLKYLVKLTPPSAGHAFTETMGAQKKAGMQAIRGDFMRAFEPLNKLAMVASPQGRLGKRILQLVRQGRADVASEVLQHGHRVIRSQGIIQTVTPELHARLRDKRGRMRTTRPFLVVQGNSITQRMKKAQSGVGYSKSGWAEAARGLRFKLPQWVGRHHAPGTYRESGSGGLRFSILMHNRVWFGLRFETSIVPAALKKLKGSVEAQYVFLINQRHKSKLRSQARFAAKSGLFLTE